MTKFSANLGFLWNDRLLPDGVRSAKAAGFDAVECHWPYEVPATEMNAVLRETGLQMLGINTARGNVDAGEVGLTAVPGRTAEAKAAIDQAVAYADKIGAKNIHAMAGMASGEDAERTFVDNLKYACRLAAESGITILIEPINHYDVPAYFLKTTGQARSIIETVGVDNLKMMFDCYHIQLMEGDLSHRLSNLLPIIGHIQFASAPDRGPPDTGEVNFRYVFRYIDDLGYDAPLGAEYITGGDTEATLGWLTSYGRGG